MSLKLTRVCDVCGEEYEQVLPVDAEPRDYSGYWPCSDCLLKGIKDNRRQRAAGQEVPAPPPLEEE